MSYSSDDAVTRPSIYKLYVQLCKDINDFGQENQAALILAYMTQAYKLGREQGAETLQQTENKGKH